MKLVIILSLSISNVIESFSIDDSKSEWENYKLTYNKNYNPKEDSLRHALFTQRLLNVKNYLKTNDESNHRLGINQFSDMTDEERRAFLGFKPSAVRNRRGISAYNLRINSSLPVFNFYTADESITLPNCVDLRATGWKEPVRQQGSCGSCWAMSVSSVISFQYFNQTKKTQQFSPQNLIDCADKYGATGCQGASSLHGYLYVLANNQSTERNYPYSGIKGECDLNRLKTDGSSHRINGFLQINSNQQSIKQCVAKVGPVSVSIAGDYLFDYGSGIWDGSDFKTKSPCDIGKINHAVTIVGYCTNSSTNEAYWIMKNSWGSSWGEKGYFRMKMDNTNLCGLWKFPYSAF